MDLIATIICYITWAVSTAWSYAADLFMLIISVFVVAINLALSILPQMTLPKPDMSGPYLGLLNSLINIGLLLDVAALLIGLTLLWKLSKFLMKYVQ